MTHFASPEQLEAARAYESLHVPALFRGWCPSVLEAARVGPGNGVLDVACGTGVLAREAVVRVGSGGKVAGIDPDPGMLAVADQLEPSVKWHHGHAESLPFPDHGLDVVVSQFGLMFFSDRERALREMLRVLKPDGRAAVAVWDLLERSPAYRVVVELLERLAGTEAADALRAPFVLGGQDELRPLFELAGFESVEITTRTGTARFPSIRVMVEAELRGWLPLMGVVLAEEKIREILDEAEGALAHHVVDSGAVVFDAPGHIVTGARPG